MSQRILVVEDDTDQRGLVASILEGSGYVVAQAGSLAEARRVLEGAPLDLVLSDWQLGDGEGTELLRYVQSQLPATAFVMVTAYGTIARAVEAVRSGADDYLSKPFERQGLLLSVDRVLRARRLQDENRRLSEELAERDRLVDLVGRAPSMQRLFRQVEKLAGTEATILVTGESGTGKELAARALHDLSRRSSGPFVPVNCAAIPEGLLESEFFGVEKGAFTGADRARRGKLEAAAGGTLFLDEVGELPLALQPKLLRFLQEGRYSRVGEAGERDADVRLIAATHRDLAAEVKEGRFREDLYYRLHVVPLAMPPLRDRREDVPLLVEHFAARAGRRHGVRVPSLPPAVLRRLLDHTWPGNVRELGNAVERLVLLAENGQVSEDDLPGSFSAQGDGASGFRLPPDGMSWHSHEKDCLRQALAYSAGNRAQAARLLDLPYKAFLYRMEKHELE
ncbi:MAG: sigma-54 dependent transcriptional regulator [Thermoanaerobaculia bacterium]|nr:sigma-54 dependent transcriptional regulator [Thermoanaerobaculia bacterium]